VAGFLHVKQKYLTCEITSCILNPNGDVMSIETIVKYGELLDRYGKLLTDRQRAFLSLYYNENLTLAEIAEEFHISRQAVHDAMKHGEEQLHMYESVLHLVRDAKQERKIAEKVLSLIPEEKKEEGQALLEKLMEGDETYAI
jgi:predicted DNA-binding protein YlxM (UPF0122 family)